MKSNQIICFILFLSLLETGGFSPLIVEASAEKLVPGCYSSRIRVRNKSTGLVTRPRITLKVEENTETSFEIFERSELNFDVPNQEDHTREYKVKYDSKRGAFKGKQEMCSLSISVFGVPRIYLKWNSNSSIRYRRTINWQYGDFPDHIEEGIGTLNVVEGRCNKF